ncbi:hypothetical protein OUZ56_014487 [Daphnia magna]|uniref:Uncharacterized protein n=1 Tax=Daphnia magna TaxID=35525 RepID=A0ABR0AJW8_9CRUS|nr:hypothetical protein OUZ56_014487 [Daphnia magna]
MSATEPAACIPAINVSQGILTIKESYYSLQEDHHPLQSLHLLCVANHKASLTLEGSSSLPYHGKLSLLILPFFSLLLGQQTWIGFNTISIFWTANIHLPSFMEIKVQEMLTIENYPIFLFTPVIINHLDTDLLSSSFAFASSLCLRRITVFVYVFTASLSSSSPHHCLCLRL